MLGTNPRPPCRQGKGSLKNTLKTKTWSVCPAGLDFCANEAHNASYPQTQYNQAQKSKV